jgi:hypothetical protein
LTNVRKFDWAQRQSCASVLALIIQAWDADALLRADGEPKKLAASGDSLHF